MERLNHSNNNRECNINYWKYKSVMISHHYNHIIKCARWLQIRMAKTKKRFLLNMLYRPRQKSGPTHERIRSRLCLHCNVNQQSQQETKEGAQHTGSCRISQGNRCRTPCQPDESAEFVRRGKACNFIIKAQWVKRRSAKPQRRPMVMFNVEYVRMMAFAFSSKHYLALKGPVRHVYSHKKEITLVFSFTCNKYLYLHKE